MPFLHAPAAMCLDVPAGTCMAQRPGRQAGQHAEPLGTKRVHLCMGVHGTSRPASEQRPHCARCAGYYTCNPLLGKCVLNEIIANLQDGATCDLDGGWGGHLRTPCLSDMCAYRDGP